MKPFHFTASSYQALSVALAAIAFAPAVVSLNSASAPVVVSLNSAAGVASWTVSNANGSIAAPAVVPGQVHLDLLTAGLIGEPYAELAVNDQHWVADEEFWTWTASFVPPPALLSKRVVELVADGIDTVATVSLNGAALLSQADAFLRAAVDVTSLLRAGRNELVVRIASPTRAALSAIAACEGFCPPPRQGPASNASSYSVGPNYVRKPQVHFGCVVRGGSCRFQFCRF